MRLTQYTTLDPVERRPLYATAKMNAGAANQQLFNVHTWRDLDETEPPPYEKSESLPPSYHETKRADRHAAIGWKGSLRRMFPVERHFEAVTLGSSLVTARRHASDTGKQQLRPWQKKKELTGVQDLAEWWFVLDLVVDETPGSDIIMKFTTCCIFIDERSKLIIVALGRSELLLKALTFTAPY